MTKNRKWILLIGLIGIGLGTWAAIYYWPNSKEADSFQEIKVQKNDLKQSVSSAGTIKAFREIEVKSRASGKILKVLARDGDWVKQGQLLLTLDKFDENAAVAQAKATVTSAKATVESATDKVAQAQRNYHQKWEMVQAHLIAKEELLQADSARITAASDLQVRKAALIQAEENLNLAKRRFSDTEIQSPISGLVLNKYVEDGQIIASGISATTGGTSLFTIGDMSKILVAAEVDEVDVGKLKVGQKVTIQVDTYANQTFRGVLTHISPKGVNKATVMVFNVEIEVVDKDKYQLKPGMTASAEIIIQEKEAVLTLPMDAVHTAHKGAWVWVKEAKEFSKKRIQLGLQTDSDTEIISGLKEGDSVYIRQLPETKKDRKGNNPNAMLRTGRMMQRGR